MIVVATLLCDRKRSSQMVAVPAISRIDASDIPGGLRLYLNIETSLGPDTFRREYAPLFSFLSNGCAIPHDVDIWARQSTWFTPPQWDQDQRRLDPIVLARNQARSYMLHKGATHLLFVDADVIVEPDGLKKLLSLRHPLVGGLVPGRGAHSHLQYFFGFNRDGEHGPTETRMVDGHPGVFEVSHGTMGYCLIERQLVSSLAFRAGVSREDFRTPLSEDPAFASDAFLNGFGRWWIHTEVRAQHWDDPQAPLKANAVASVRSIPI